MKKNLLTFFICAFLNSLSGFASPIAGGEITYRYIGNKKYDVIFKFYRDCRGTSENQNTFNFGLVCPSTTQFTKLSATLISIKEVSYNCKTDTIKCDPPNTMINSARPIFEEHTYKYTLDFDGSEAAFVSCCQLKLFMNRCCRNNDINTGPAGSDFYITSDLDICLWVKNSSPTFAELPRFVVFLNQPNAISIGASDTVDYDSLSYSFTRPLQSLTDSVKWSNGFNYNNPLSVYWPTGYDKNKGPSPGADPPIGLFLGSETGDLIFTAVDTNQTIICIAVKEWRKDGSGIYKQIGEIRREINVIVKVSFANNPPILLGPYKYEICAGTQICFTIVSDDKQFIPPPPQKPNQPDSVRLTWNRGIPGSTFSIVDPKARLQKGRFCWTPKESQASDLPYTFTVTARDNSCPVNAITIKSYSVKVKLIARTGISINNLSNDKVIVESKPDLNFKGTPQYYWEVLDSTSNTLDTNYFYFGNKRGYTSNRQSDTVKFLKTGTFIFYHYINNSPFNCPYEYLDTVVISSLTNGIANLKNSFITIFPNPANKSLTIKTVKSFDNGSVEIYNPLGELIIKQELLQNETVIKIDELANGLYFLNVKNERTNWSYKFIKTE